MTIPSKAEFDQQYQQHLKCLKLNGYQPKTIDAYARAIRYLGKRFDYNINNLSEQQLTDYLYHRLTTHSWNAIKLDLYGIKQFYRHVLKKPWSYVGLIKPPRTKRLPDIVTIEEAARIFNATQKLSYRVLYFTLYSMGLRLGEGLRLEVGDIDATRHRVHIRNAKGNKDRFVPLPDMTLDVLRRFWAVHRNPVLIFPNRKGGLRGSFSATTPLDRGGVQITMHKAVAACGIKKKLRPTACATVMLLT
ncbi:MAG: site-specific integrase [Mariprofundales bacterium]